ncbi:drug/metabolite transporter (DMT)-like permease [Winogradskyella epiphytica]|uniref:Drug/metabolite transporter (DMT)-like permease n=1 Tax=Winogradskyella epiphytica TaxID=262005 RepID=A0A2V4XCB9_9FLAO|nr:DMT family transporter [Winogradskyella epiphytica]PYE80131.1 drug/metabolite transporter (DMT)-like permease [Winogradskyella epiphytica]
MTKPRIALAVGIICISIFPILVKLNLSPGLVSAFYRMAIASALIVPYVFITKQFKITSRKALFMSMLCGVVFGLDVGVWNIAIQQSTATQATLLTNLSPVWVGIGAFFFLKDKPRRNFWIGTVVAIIGMVLLVGFDLFINFDFNLAFIFGILSGMLYAVYMLTSKRILGEMEVMTFMTVSLLSSVVALGSLSYALDEPFSGFSAAGWWSLVVQGLVCQLMAWLLISYATKHMRATRVSVSLLGQAVLASILAWWLLDEQVSLQMVIGGIILLLGIRLTFYEKPVIDTKA